MLGSADFGFRLHYHLRDEAKLAAETLGFEWDDYLMEEVDRCAAWWKAEVERRKKRYDDMNPKKPDKQPQEM